MKANLVIALVSVGALCLLGPAQARSGGGGHNSNSGTHASSQNKPAAAKQTAKKKGNKEPYMKYELKNATVSAAKAKKGKGKGKVNVQDLHFTTKVNKASPQ